MSSTTSLPGDDPSPSALALIRASKTAQNRTLSALVGLRGNHEGRRLWSEACQRAHIDDGQNLLTLDELNSVADELATLEGPLAMVGNSLSIRIHTYNLLARTHLLADFLGTETS